MHTIFYRASADQQNMCKTDERNGRDKLGIKMGKMTKQV